MKTCRPHRLIPCAATVLTLTVAAQLKVEHSCSQERYPPPQTSPSVIYPYPEILASGRCLAPGVYGVRFRKTARAGAPSCPATFIGNTIKS